MTNSKIVQKDETKVLDALNDYVSVVASTMGPGGKNVLVLNTHLGRMNGMRSTQDGVGLTQMLTLNQSAEAMAVSYVCREMSDRTWLQAGDGTTSTLVLLRAFYGAYLDLVKQGYGKADVLAALRWLSDFAARVWPDLADKSWMSTGRTGGDPASEEGITDEERTMLMGLAMVATHGDASLSELLVDAQAHIGRWGKIEVVSSQERQDHLVTDDRLERGRGMRLDTRLLRRDFANTGVSNRVSWRAEHGCYVVLSETAVATDQDMQAPLGVFNALVKNDHVDATKPILFVAPLIGEQAMAYMHKAIGAGYHVMGLSLSTVYDEGQVQDVLEDLHRIAGGVVFGANKGRPLTQAQRFNKDYQSNVVFGFLEGTVDIGVDATRIDFAEGKEMERAQGWVSRLHMQAAGQEEGADTDEELAAFREALVKRANRILGRTAKIILRGGAGTDQRRRWDLADDGARTLAAAERSGVVPAQGVSYLMLISAVEAIRHMGPSANAYEMGVNDLPAAARKLLGEELGSRSGNGYALREALLSVRSVGLRNAGHFESAIVGNLFAEQEKEDARHFNGGEFDFLMDVILPEQYIIQRDGSRMIAADCSAYDGADVPLSALRNALAGVELLANPEYVVSVDQVSQ